MEDKWVKEWTYDPDMGVKSKRRLIDNLGDEMQLFLKERHYENPTIQSILKNATKYTGTVRHPLHGTCVCKVIITDELANDSVIDVEELVLDMLNKQYQKAVSTAPSSIETG